jgi:hypothetical protein
MPNITFVRQLEEVHATAAALRLLSDSSAEAPGRLSYLESWGNPHLQLNSQTTVVGVGGNPHVSTRIP